MKKLRLGVIGYGDSAHDFTRAAQYADHWEAVAVGGRNMKKASAFAEKNGVEAVLVDDMVKRNDIDVIAVSTPPGASTPDAMKVLDHKKHLVREKPMALNLEDCDRLIARAREQKVHLMISQSVRFFPGSTKAKELIENGEIGQVLMVQEHLYYNYFSAKRTGWQVDPKQAGGGVVFNPILHMTDRIRYIADSEIISVDARLGYANRQHPGIDGNAHVFYRMNNGLTGSILIYGYDGMHETITCTIFGSEGMITISGWATSCCLHKNGKKVDSTGKTYMKNPKDPVNVSYLGHMVEWEEAIRNGTPLPSPGENGRANVAATLAIQESHRTGKAISIK